MPEREKFESLEGWAIKAYSILFTLAESDGVSPEAIKEAAVVLIAEAPKELELIGSLTLVSLLADFSKERGLL